MNFLHSYSKNFEDILLNIGTNLRICKVFQKNKEDKLFSSIEYSYTNGGKRLRPILSLLSAEAILNSKNFKQDHGTVAECQQSHKADLKLNPAMGLALAIELIHCGSLVHDDLPCMDNDALRRGKPTNHIVYGEDLALLTGDFLLVNPLSIFIEYSQDTLKLDDSLILKVASHLMLAVQQMIVGQAMDLELAKQNFRLKTAEDLSSSEIEYFEKSKLMQEYKTGAILSAAIVNGALLAGANPSQLQALDKYAANLGLAFQITDDILDQTSSIEQMGKQTQKDMEQNKLTYVDLYGLDGAIAKAEELITEAKEILSATEIYSDKLKLIADYVIRRNN